MADAARCVHCGQRPIEPRYRPFCSERCRMADLGRWLGGEYRIAGAPADGLAGHLERRNSGEDPETEP